jgi:hypothetical protein
MRMSAASDANLRRRSSPERGDRADPWRDRRLQCALAAPAGGAVTLYRRLTRRIVVTVIHRPEIGMSVDAAGIRTNYLVAGAGTETVILIHGSGPGVTAYANWRLVIPALAEHFHVIAPDMVGFGYSDRPDNVTYGLQTWADQVVGLLDSLDIAKAHIVGNSFGGAIALRVATQHPDRVDKMVLMGSMGVSFPITEGLDRVWG